MTSRPNHHAAIAALRLLLAAAALTGCSARDEAVPSAENVAATSAAYTTDGTLRSLPSFGDKCVSTNGYTFAGGTQLILWDCVGQDNEKWSYTADGEIRGFGDKCVAAGAVLQDGGVDVVLADCDGSPSQRWRWGANGKIGNYRYPSMALSTYGYQHGNGTRLVLWSVPPTGLQDNQQWSVPACADSTPGWCHEHEACRWRAASPTEVRYSCVCPPEQNGCYAGDGGIGF